jgi:hypothetical protein
MRWLPLLALLAACGGSSTTPSSSTDHHEEGTTVIIPDPVYPADDSTALVIGLTADSFAPAIGADIADVQLIVTVDGKQVIDKTVKVSTLPLETKVKGPAGKPNARVDVIARGLLDFSTVPQPRDASEVVVRRASASFVKGQTKLLRVSLDERCASSAPLMAGGPPPILGPSCADSETCSLGRCIDKNVPETKLEAHEGWTTRPPPDECVKPDAATLAVGMGRTFAPFPDVLPLEAGGQGGYHVWLTIRTTSVGQYATTTKITAKSGDEEIPSISLRTPYVPETGTCTLNGLRFQLASWGAMLCPLRGKTLDFTVTTTEASGRVTTGTASSKVPDTLPQVMGRDPCTN